MHEVQFLLLRAFRSTLGIEPEHSERGQLTLRMLAVGVVLGYIAAGLAADSFDPSWATLIGSFLGAMAGLLLTVVWWLLELLTNDWPIECALERSLIALVGDLERAMEIVSRVCPEDDHAYHPAILVYGLLEHVPDKRAGVRVWLGAAEDAAQMGYVHLCRCLNRVLEHLDPAACLKGVGGDARTAQLLFTRCLELEASCRQPRG